MDEVCWFMDLEFYNLLFGLVFVLFESVGSNNDYSIVCIEDGGEIWVIEDLLEEFGFFCF